MQPNYHSVSLRLLVLCPYISISLPYLLFQYILIYIICKLLLLRLICISAEFILFLAKSLLTHLNFYLAQVFSKLHIFWHSSQPIPAQLSTYHNTALIPKVHSSLKPILQYLCKLCKALYLSNIAVFGYVSKSILSIYKIYARIFGRLCIACCITDIHRVL